MTVVSNNNPTIQWFTKALESAMQGTTTPGGLTQGSATPWETNNTQANSMIDQWFSGLFDQESTPAAARTAEKTAEKDTPASQKDMLQAFSKLLEGSGFGKEATQFLTSLFGTELKSSTANNESRTFQKLVRNQNMSWASAESTYKKPKPVDSDLGLNNIDEEDY